MTKNSTPQFLIIAFLIFISLNANSCNQIKFPGISGSGFFSEKQHKESGLVSISEIQGQGDVSPYLNQKVVTCGIVTAVFEGREAFPGAGFAGDLKGFFIQDRIGDGNPLSSEGLLIYYTQEVNTGDSVVITGIVREYYGLTELKEVTDFKIASQGNSLPPATLITLPLAENMHLESFEGMLVQFPQELTVTENRNLDDYGELGLSSKGLFWQPTQRVDPNDTHPEGITSSGNSNAREVKNYSAQNQAKFIILDDCREENNPTPIPYLENGTLSTGSKIYNLTGILTYSYNKYRIMPTRKPEFSYAQREAFPVYSASDLRIASFNVLNYFNGNGQGGGFPTSRGAKTQEEFQKQTQKIVAAILEIEADILGLIEIENDEDNGYSAISDLVKALNLASGQNNYRFLSTGKISSYNGNADAIKTAFIYKPASVELYGDYAILNSAIESSFNDFKNRPSLAQSFRHKQSGEIFTLIINHLKSKGSDCESLGDPDDGDGQGNCNLTRTRAAAALTTWLITDPTGSKDPDFLILGDLNSYAQEDPIDTLRSMGFINLLSDTSYSYVYSGQYGTLDYALVSPSFQAQIAETKVWHINSVQPDFLAYYADEEHYTPSPYRSSDHDPVIIELNMETASSRKQENSFMNKIRIYPNPFENEFTLSFHAENSGEFHLEIRNTEGKLIFQSPYKIHGGMNTLMISSLEDHDPGVYSLSVRELGIIRQIIKVDKQ